MSKFYVGEIVLYDKDRWVITRISKTLVQIKNVNSGESFGIHIGFIKKEN